MAKVIEDSLEKIPIVNILVRFGKKIKIPGLKGMSLYDVLEMYGLGIVKGAVTTRAGGIAFSFFMAIFPFLLFILSLIPYIPIDGFQDGLFALIKEGLPPKTFDAVNGVINDIIKNQYSGLLSFGFLASIFLMTNGVNAIFGGFEYSYHVKEYRNIFRSYFVSLAVSLLMALFLIITVVLIIYYQIALVKIDEQGWLDTTDLNLFYWGRGLLFLLMIFTIVSLLFRFGTKQGKEVRFFSPGAILTTALSLFTFYLFGIYVVKFATYNKLYGSIGTLLVLMLFVWLNAIILLLGFELNASMYRLRKRTRVKNLPKITISNALKSNNPIERLRKMVEKLQEAGAEKEEVYDLFHEYSLDLKGKTEAEITILEDAMDMISGWYVGQNIPFESDSETS